jgi:uncharacterized membrane protein YhhN
MIASIIFLVLGVVSIVLFLFERVKNYSVKGTAIKSVASVFFIAIAVSGWFNSFKSGNISLFGGFIILGLLFGLLGDIYLELKCVYPKEDKIFTYLGFIVFGIGHVLYITGMNLEYYIPGNIIYIIIPIVLAIIFTIGVLLLEKPMKVRYGNFKIIVVLYSFILSLMMATAGSLAIMHSFNNMTLNLMFIGGIFFVVSDLILSGTYFGEGKERPVDLISNIAVYYIAQYVIAFSVLFLM